jgi:hypothetical protein
MASHGAARPGAARRLRSLALAGLLTLSAGVIGVPSVAAVAPRAPGDCPAIMAKADIVTGSTGQGWTVVSGTTRVPFHVEFLGILVDGLFPGKDLIIVRVSDEPGYDFIQKANGIWAGISGSPVYQAGKLVGSTSYSLNIGEAFLAGLTPAEDMAPILGYAVGSASQRGPAASHVTIPASLRSTIGQRIGTSVPADSTFDRLPLPMSVSGLSAAARARLQQIYDKAGMSVVVTPGSRATKPTAATPFVRPQAGGNFVSLLSYGDLTAGGIGSTTYVCDNQALAFGHPFGFFGKSFMAANDGDAIAIVPGLMRAFKLANITAPFGIVDQDRFSGVRATLGISPTTVAVTARVTSVELGTSRTGRTDVTDQRFLPGIAAFHLFYDIEAVADSEGPASAAVRWTIRGRRANGDPFTVYRGNRYASQSVVAFGPVDDINNDLNALISNQFEDVAIDSVQMSARVKEGYQPYTVASAKISKNGGPFLTRTQMVVHPGDVLRVRTTLQRYHAGVRKVTQAITVPFDFPGGGLLIIGQSFFDTPPSGAKTFDELIAQLNGQARRDDLNTRIVTFDPITFGTVELASTRTHLDAVVSGGLSVDLTGAPPPGP